MPATRLSAAEITAFLDEVFPGSMEYFVIEDVRPMHARVRMVFNEFRLRPGGMWLVKAVHMVPAHAGTNAEWASFWASLTFELRTTNAAGN